jgi:hypothetical protein
MQHNLAPIFCFPPSVVPMLRLKKHLSDLFFPVEYLGDGQSGLDGPKLITRFSWYQSKNISDHKNVSYEGHLCPIIVKSQRAPNAQATQHIIHRHYEELKSSSPDSQTLKNPF